MAAPPGILEVRCAGCGETLEVEHGLTEFACPDCGMAQSLPQELMPPRPRRALPLPGRGAPYAASAPPAAHARVSCGGCGSVLSVPHGPGRFACPLCGIELASFPLAAVPVVVAPAAVPISSTRPMNVSEVQQPSSQSARAGMVQKPIHSEQTHGQQHKHYFGEESFNSFRAEPRTQIDAARTLQIEPPNPSVRRDESHTEPVQGTIARPGKRTQIDAVRTLQNELPNASIHREESHTEPVQGNIARSGKRTYRFVFGRKSWQEGNVQKEQPIQVVHASQAQVMPTESSVHTNQPLGGFPDDAIPIHSKQRTEHVDVPSAIEHEQIRSQHQVVHEQRAGENPIDTVHMKQEKVGSACKPSSKIRKSAENTKGSYKRKNNNLINVHASQAQVMLTESSIHINQAEGGFPDDTVPMHGKQRTRHVAVPSAIEHEQVCSRHQVDHEQQEGENPSDGVHMEQEKVGSACKPSSKYIKSTENTKGNRKRKNKNLMNSSNERPHLRRSKRLSKGSPDFIDVEPIQKVDASPHRNHSEAPQIESSIADQTYSPETGWALPNPGSSSWHEQEIPQKSFSEIDQLDGSDEEVHSNPSDNQNQYMDGQVAEAACSGKNHSEQVRLKPHIKNFAEHGRPMNLAASCSRLAALLPVPASATLPTISSISSPEKLPPQCSSPTTPQNQPPTVIYSQDAQCDDMPSGSLTKSLIKRKGRPPEVLVEPRKEADKPVLTPRDEQVEGGEGTLSSTVYQRGGTRLPTEPVTPAHKALITPDGESGWTYAKGVRNPNGILGVLIRQNFPGMVQLPFENSVPEPGLHWEHYVAAQAPANTTINGVECHTRADMVLNGFWVYYKVSESMEEQAAKVLDFECKRLLQNVRHEMRVQSIRDYYAKRGLKRSKAECRVKFLRREQYMMAPPRWCADKMDVWEVIVNQWCSDAWLAIHNNAKDRRAQMVGVPHHQGSRNLAGYGQKWAEHNKTEVLGVFDNYGMAHTSSYKKAKALSESDIATSSTFTNVAAYDKLKAYSEVAKEKHGEDYDPRGKPIDPELVMISSGGRRHGAMAIGDRLIRCPLTLPQIKARQTSSAPAVRTRGRPVDLAIEAALEKERQKTQELLAEMAERERLAEERTAKALEEAEARHDGSNRALYELIVTMCEKQGQVAPPMPVITPAGTHNSRAASHDPSPGSTSANPDGSQPPQPPQP